MPQFKERARNKLPKFLLQLRLNITVSFSAAKHLKAVAIRYDLFDVHIGTISRANCAYIKFSLILSTKETAIIIVLYLLFGLCH